MVQKLLQMIQTMIKNDKIDYIDFFACEIT